MSTMDVRNVKCNTSCIDCTRGTAYAIRNCMMELKGLNNANTYAVSVEYLEKKLCTRKIE